MRSVKSLILRRLLARRDWLKANGPARSRGECNSDLLLALSLFIAAASALLVIVIVMLIVITSPSVPVDRDELGLPVVLEPAAVRLVSGDDVDGTIHPRPAGATRLALRESSFGKKVGDGTQKDAAAVDLRIKNAAEKSRAGEVAFVCDAGLCMVLESDVDRIDAALRKCARGLAI